MSRGREASRQIQEGTTHGFRFRVSGLPLHVIVELDQLTAERLAAGISKPER